MSRDTNLESGISPKKIFHNLSKLFDKNSDSHAGHPPGTPVHVGAPHEFQPTCSLLRYNNNETREFSEIALSELSKELLPDNVNWINVVGIHNIEFIQEISTILDLHPLTQEDIVDTTVRPQFDMIADYSFITLKLLYIDGEANLISEQISLVIKQNIVLMFQELPGDVCGKIRERIRLQSGPICGKGSDYLLYLILDSIVDGYYAVIDNLGERIDSVEKLMRVGARDEILSQTFGMRREILILRKNIVPVRDVLNKVQVAGTIFQNNTLIYMKDLTDHILQVTESLNIAADMSNVLIDTYDSIQNQRLNAVMKTLTMISTIFLPLNFIAGVYGMNFVHMPETQWIYGYPMAIGAMLIVSLGMIGYFIRRGWLLEKRNRRQLKNEILNL